MSETGKGLKANGWSFSNCATSTTAPAADLPTIFSAPLVRSALSPQP
jgi:hypothetical protein